MDESVATGARRRWLRWGLVLAGWTVPALLSSTQIYLRYALQGESMSWWETFQLQAMTWYVWAALTPVVVLLGRRWPLGRRQLGRSIAVHVPAGAVVSAAYATAYALILAATQVEDFDQYAFSEGVLKILTWRFHTDFLIYWAILAVSHAFEYYGRYRDRELRATRLESQLSRARLDALEMQLHPHFLFNTLHAISTLIRKGDSGGAVDMLNGLSELLRRVLQHVGTQEVTLAEEIELAEYYLDIQQRRYGERLKVELRIAPDTLDARVPTLLLQPLLENAIRHGTSRKTSTGSVLVRTARDDEWLTIEVCDDGPGLPDGWTADACDGVGLRNTRARLEQLYGTRQRIELVPSDDGGVCARVVLPIGEEIA